MATVLGWAIRKSKKMPRDCKAHTSMPIFEATFLFASLGIYLNETRQGFQDFRTAFRPGICKYTDFIFRVYLDAVEGQYITATATVQVEVCLRLLVCFGRAKFPTSWCRGLVLQEVNDADESLGRVHRRIGLFDGQPTRRRGLNVHFTSTQWKDNTIRQNEERDISITSRAIPHCV